MRFYLALLLSILLLAPQVRAEAFANAGQSKVNYNATPTQSTMRCADLTAISNYEYTIISSINVVATADVPGHCRVTGLVPSEVRFEINLPTNWNDRLYMFGNGGLAGTPATDPAKQYARDLALANGFVTAYTDTGHDKRVLAGGEFAHLNLHKLVDYGFRAVHLTVTTAKSLAQAFYGNAPRHSYWNGCSTGGRQGMISAQRFPEDFDGIIAGAPAADYSGLKFSQAWRVAAISKSGLTEAEVLQLADHIYAACDGLDGLTDGLISDPRRCDFDVDRDLPHCAGEDTIECFDVAERDALKKYYSPTMLAGQQIYPAMLVGSEAAGYTSDDTGRSGWVPWLINGGKQVLLDALGSDFFRYMTFVVDRPEFDWTAFDFQTPPDNLDEFNAIVNATNPDLGRFKANGGKLLTYFGWADPDINPLTLLAYRDEVAAGDSDIDKYFRTFMVPGMFHCRGGPGPDRFDAMTPLVEWVEAGHAPDQIDVWRQSGSGVRTDTRPLCAYPKEAWSDDSGLVCSLSPGLD